MRRFGLLVAFFMTFFSSSYSDKKSLETFVQRSVDSLDRIQPVLFKRARLRGRTFTIKVSNQQEFDRLNETLSEAICAGRTKICVRIGRGIFHFKENHIALKGIPQSIAITIVGKRTVLTSYPDIKEADNNPWDEMVQMDGIIQVIDNNKKLCMIPYPNQWTDERRRAMTQVQITQWYRAPVYDVKKIDSKGIYFIAKELDWNNNHGRKGYNVNFDFLYLGKNPRFRLYDKRKYVTATASSFIKVENTAGLMMEMSGILFKGNKGGHPLITMNDVNSQQIYIHDCIFEHIHDTVGSFSNVSNVCFDCNVLRNTAGNEVRFERNCTNVQVTNNLFEKSGLAIGQTFCVLCWEGSYYIAHNTFRDFGYAAIGVGVWYGFKKEYSSQGIIEHNEIYFTPNYLAEVWKHTLMDSGAIYTWTQNDDVIIRYNYIHDYCGAGDNRGLFCDDGACNLKIYGNIVLNIPNSYCLDSRRSKDQHDGLTNNANNFMSYNVVDGRVRFQGYGDEERHCVKGANFVIKDKKYVENIIDNMDIYIEDVEVQSVHESQKFKELRKFKIVIK